MTHKELVDLTASRVESMFGCGMILKEPKTIRLHYSPDVFAVKKGGVTFQFEIKVSRSDFLKDQVKGHRTSPEKDVGLFRYYVVPWGLVLPDDPLLSSNGVKWGLIWVEGGSARRLRVMAGPNPRKAFNKFADGSFKEYECPRDHMAEMEFIYSLYRSLVMGSCGEAIKVGSIAERIYSDALDLKATCSRMR